MATSKALRSSPPRLLDNYVVSIKRFEGQAPVSIPDSSFIKSDYVTDETSTGLPAAVNKPIGFDFNVNNTAYKKFALYGHGWFFLQDPSATSVDVTDVLSTSNDDENDKILDTFSYNHILLAPWFDSANNIPATVDTIAASAAYNSTITSDILEDIKLGKNVKNWPYSPIDGGVRYKNFYDAKNGRGLIIRWSTAQGNYNVKSKFDAVLFENGKIEFRYWPLEKFAPGDSGYSTGLGEATVGIFWNYPAANKFRDFSAVLNYRPRNSELGGSAYDSSYSESAQPYSNLLTNAYWPKGGAVISFNPPVNHVKFLPRKLVSAISSNREIVRSPGRFDDRKSIAFRNNVPVNLPSGLPTRLFGDTGDINVPLQQLLFTSGSILATGSINKTIFSAQLEQLDALESVNETKDFSFNEAQKNYGTTLEATGFYATGSSLELFGEGFTAPLKSKTQLQFSLPVTKPVVMPAQTSSFYYYDKGLRQWINPAPQFCSNPKIKTVSLEANKQDGDYSSYYTYIVTETAVGFDAVGRRIVSGTIPQSYQQYSVQSDTAVGAFFNAPGSRFVGALPISFIEKDENSQSTSIAKKFNNTITDNSSFYPPSSQAFDVSVDYPFLIEKVVASIPLYISGDWFKDKTTCNKAFGTNGIAQGLTSGAIDFGGPGITFSLLCGRKALNSSYLDIITSGTITHTADNTGSVELYKNSGMNNYVLRPVGFKAFSNPTAVISGSNNIFDGKVKLELTPSIAGGLTLTRNDRSLHTNGNYSALYNRPSCVQLLTSPTLITAGENAFNAYDMDSSNATNYSNRSTRIYLQQISPLSRGTTGVEFSGNSILGSNIASFNFEQTIRNPFYYAASGSLSAEFKSKIDSANFAFESIGLYSTIDSRPSPYLILPGDKLTIALSKTRPVMYQMTGDNPFGPWDYSQYSLTGSHGTVMLNTGSIEITLYGSYVREGMEYNP